MYSKSLLVLFLTTLALCAPSQHNQKCPPHTKPWNSYCLPSHDPSCPANYYWNGLSCVSTAPSSAPNCGDAFFWNGWSCVSNSLCAPNANYSSCSSDSFWDGFRCISVENLQQGCANGYTWTGFVCAEDISFDFKKFFGKNEKYLSCEVGSYWDGRVCQPLRFEGQGQKCDREFYWNGASCKKAQKRTEGESCPAGLYWNGAVCLPVYMGVKSQHCQNGHQWNLKNCGAITNKFQVSRPPTSNGYQPQASNARQTFASALSNVGSPMNLGFGQNSGSFGPAFPYTFASIGPFGASASTFPFNFGSNVQSLFGVNTLTKSPQGFDSSYTFPREKPSSFGSFSKTSEPAPFNRQTPICEGNSHWNGSVCISISCPRGYIWSDEIEACVTAVQSTSTGRPSLTSLINKKPQIQVESRMGTRNAMPFGDKPRNTESSTFGNCPIGYIWNNITCVPFTTTPLLPKQTPQHPIPDSY